MATASPNETLRVQKTVTNLDDFADVTLVKTGTFTPANDAAEALSRVGGDSAKFLTLVNEGLRAEAQRTLRDASGGWQQEDEEGNLSAFSGTPADSTKVNALVLTLAKTVFGYSKELTPEQKKAAKSSAMDMIKGNDAIKSGLKTSAAM